jgi:hypothetical protein
MPIISATQEVEAGRSQFQINTDKSTRPYLKNKLKGKDRDCSLSCIVLA